MDLGNCDRNLVLFYSQISSSPAGKRGLLYPFHKMASLKSLDKIATRLLIVSPQ